jgi:surfeit locus 1 family protein
MRTRLPGWVRILLVSTIPVVAIGMLGLGVWQLERLQERRTLNAEIRRRLAEPPLTLNGSLLTDTARLEYRPVRVRGVFDFSQEIVLRNRAHAEMPGVHVITPLKIQGSEKAVLIDRGWIPYEVSNPATRAAYHTPVGEVEVKGILRRSQTRPYSFLPVDPTLSPELPRLDEWYWLNIDQIQAQVSYPLVPMLMAAAPAEDAQGSQLPIAGYDIDLSEGPHLSYAIQWFAFAAIAVFGPLAYWRQHRKQ